MKVLYVVPDGEQAPLLTFLDTLEPKPRQKFTVNSRCFQGRLYRGSRLSSISP